MVFDPEKLPKKDENSPTGRVICSWCKKDMGPAESKADTHGICEECKKTIFEDKDTPEK